MVADGLAEKFTANVPKFC